MICRQKRTHLNLGPAPALQPALSPQPAPRRRGKPPNRFVMPWILQIEETGCYRTLLANLIQTGMPGYQNFCLVCLIFIHHHIKKSLTNFRKPLEVGLKQAITMGHLGAGETNTSLQYHWLVSRTTTCKFFPVVC